MHFSASGSFMLSVLSYLLLLVPVLVNVAFITLLERKILGYSQLRKGPNKVSLGGVLQPFSDAVKLFTKESFVLSLTNFKYFFFSPGAALGLVLMVFMVYPFKEQNYSLSLSVVSAYMLMALNVYPLMLGGWASNSKYALLGAMRGVAQTVSYEVCFALILMFYLFNLEVLSFYSLTTTNDWFFKVFLCMPLGVIFLVVCLAETNRTPFDFAEGESELVSGFNVEYGSFLFALIFMAEYASILFLSIIFTLVFWASSLNSLWFLIMVVVWVGVWVWVRATLPRYRYDKLMGLAWKIYLPCVLSLPGLVVFLGQV